MKDAFEKVYSFLLARRLVEHTSVSDDAEAGMISKLKVTLSYIAPLTYSILLSPCIYIPLLQSLMYDMKHLISTHNILNNHFEF